MIRRIVKMTFEETRTDEFLQIFQESREKIRAFPGCHRLELLRDIDHPNIFFTYSYWNEQKSLDNYRNSELFKTTWKKTKTLFSEKPNAWSTRQESVLE